MRMVLCWSDISGYMTACWRALSAVPDVDLRVIAFEPKHKSFAADLVQGVNCHLLTPDQRHNAELVRELIMETRPDILYVSGWFHPPYRKAIVARELEVVSRWIGVDTPWTGAWRQHLARVVLRPFIGRLDRVFVPGERAWQYARMLGAPQSKVCRGLYGIDYAAFLPLHAQRVQQAGGWPRRFLFTGRYAPEKGLDVLVEAYARYRASVSNPWSLSCCGGGKLERLLREQPGVEDLGFRQPAELLEVMRRHGVFVLASHFDPWPLVIAEACAAGLPVLCTEACGSAVELVRPYFNGIAVATGDADALTRAMRWVHEHSDRLSEMGRRGRELASAFSAQAWAIRWSEAAREVMTGRG